MGDTPIYKAEFIEVAGIEPYEVTNEPDLIPLKEILTKMFEIGNSCFLHVQKKDDVESYVIFCYANSPEEAKNKMINYAEKEVANLEWAKTSSQNKSKGSTSSNGDHIYRADFTGIEQIEPEEVLDDSKLEYFKEILDILEEDQKCCCVCSEDNNGHYYRTLVCYANSKNEARNKMKSMMLTSKENGGIDF